LDGTKMAEQKSPLAFHLSLVGAILILLNGLLIAFNGAPLILSSTSVSSPTELTGVNATSWSRIAFGIQSCVSGSFILIWLLIAVAALYSALMIYLRPARQSLWGWLLVVFSILSIFIGGGFIIGLILGVVGGSLAVEKLEPPGETFFGRLLRALKLESRLFESVSENPKTLNSAAKTLIFINILSGLGYGIYSFNLDNILHPSSANVPFRILMVGDILWSLPAFAPALMYIGVAILKWFILSFLIYIIGVKFLGAKSDMDKIGRVVAYAYAPICLQFFVLFIFTSEALSKTWPLAVFFLTNLWMGLALVVALRQIFEISIGRALGVVLLAGTAYWLVNTFFIIQPLNLPCIWLTITPPEVILEIASLVIIVATILGVFIRR
jgi:hypothetical protein